MKTEREKRLEAALRQIEELESATRVGGADPMDLEGLDNALHEALQIAREALADEGAGSDDRFSHWTERHGDIGTFYARPEGFKVWPRMGPGLDGLWAVNVPGQLYTEEDAPIVTAHYESAEEAMAAVDHNWPVKDDEPDETPRHGGDFVGTGGPLPGEPGNPNPSFEQMENGTAPQRRDALEVLADEFDFRSRCVSDLSSALWRVAANRVREVCRALSDQGNDDG